VNEVLTVTFADDSTLDGRSISLATGTVTVQGGVYRPAVGALQQAGSLFAGGGTLNLGSVRVGGLFAAQTLDVANTAQAGDDFSEKLNASLVASGSGLTSGSVSLLAAGSVSAGALSFGFDPTTSAEAGLKSGTAVVSFVTDGDGTSQLGTLGVGSQSVQLTGKVFRTASGTLTGGTSLTLAAVREGGAFASGTVAVSNTASDDFSEKLNVQLSGATGDASISAGTLNLLAAGSADMAESKRDCVPSPRALAKALLSRMVVCTSIAVVCGCCTVSALSGTPISLAIYEVATFGAASGAPSASCRTAEKTA
jgi:hypothetical protein